MYMVSQVRKSDSGSFKVLIKYEIYINLQIDILNWVNTYLGFYTSLLFVFNFKRKWSRSTCLEEMNYGEIWIKISIKLGM